MGELIVAVDVGTASARAGVFTLEGRQVTRAVAPIRVLQPAPGHFEQISNEIWQAVIDAVRAAMRDANAGADDVRAIGFDATCSLVIRDPSGGPLSVSASGEGPSDTLLWMDHRAICEADELSIAGDPLVARFGGRLSPEMQLPKLLWLKRHLPATWAGMGQAFDLSDYLTWRATGSPARSHSPLASKWGYAPAAPGARPDDFFACAGLADLPEKAGLPPQSQPPSLAIGKLSHEARIALGLGADCIVAPGLIDAYAGAIGVFCGSDLARIERQAALVAGTSSCVVTFASREINHPGCWGTFRDAALPGLWLMEAGQSASGALLDHVLRMHPAGGEPTRERHLQVLNHIAGRLDEEGPGYGLPIALLPDLHGSRSPVSDPSLTGMMTGMTLDTCMDGLAKLYWRACVALACGIRHILEHLPQGERIESLLMTGGFAGHPLIPQLYADVTGRAIRLHEGRDAVLLGTAINAGLAAGLYHDLADASGRMTTSTKTVAPRPEAARAHERDYVLYRTMLRQRDELTAILKAAV
jgi:FGGY-family pentulose kinase